VSVNGRIVKASYDVKQGDRLELSFGGRVLRVEVTRVAEHAAKEDAGAMYVEI
jgi:ribosomal 50S subunit-recycling heat shock protein